MTASKKHLEPGTELVRELAQLLSESNLSEIEYENADCRIRVARAPGAPLAGAIVHPATAAAADGLSDVSPAARDDAALMSHPGLLTSPMVGVAYTSPDPDAAPFVRAGNSVSEGETVLLIEAMKVFNPIAAPRSGRVLRIFVANGTPVEYGEPLLIIE
jgi:acetyl-CoA carboxylase biotin carboxyl carrier protein